MLIKQEAEDKDILANQEVDDKEEVAENILAHENRKDLEDSSTIQQVI